jgi:RNA polymerase sigma-70 factor (ECF subfamily)
MFNLTVHVFNERALCNNRPSGDIYPQMPFTGDHAQPSPDRRFEDCFRDNYAAVLAFAIRRLPDRAAAEDAAAETFAVVWRRRDLIPEEPLPWVFGIALRVVANQRRSGQRRRRLDERLEREAGSRAASREPVDDLHRRDAFSHAFGRLGEGEREVLRLVAWDGLDAREAADVLGCSTAAFRVRLHRARRKLAKHLEAAGHSPDERPARASNPAEEAS